eukprot:TRINITY_DN8640_c0_g1_i1.p1 TRINITY_DN8640_c0_g1~~TRINITY_DN8640_c0_g1_i1.p1  ORF type:complete len:302 (+),score=27.30 TRINITY_DN8640_c0_g1_i1:18-923(+)
MKPRTYNLIFIGLFLASALLAFKSGQLKSLAKSVPKRVHVTELLKRSENTYVKPKIVKDAPQHALVVSFEKPSDPLAPWIETISWEPRIQVFHNFLTPKECQDIIKIGESRVTRSSVVGFDTHEGRTSHGTFFMPNDLLENPVLRLLEKRIANWTMIPVSHGESFNLLRYEVGQQYKPHFDYFDENNEEGRRYLGPSGNRIATVLCYLQKAESGGGTGFPNVGVEVEPNTGDAILFWSMKTDNSLTEKALHAGLPVISGTKWAMTKWIRVKPIGHWADNLSAEQRASLWEKEQTYLQQLKN